DLCQHVYRGFRSAVMRVACPRAYSPERAYVDDSALSFAKRVQSFLRNQERAAGIGSKHRIPLRQAQFLKLSCLIIRSIVHKNIDASQILHGLLQHDLHIYWITYVAIERHSEHSDTAHLNPYELRLAR